ncbi:MAG: hypothetical protein V1492_05605 [Candidatus Micrarchaeota archaeon]
MQNQKNNKGFLKGQAAMEYLMTYGLALFIIIIVLALIASYLPKLIQTPENCMFTQPGLTCSKQIIYYDAVNKIDMVTFKFENQQGQAIDLKGIVCTTMPATSINKTFVIDKGGLTSRLSAGQVIDTTVPCYEADGKPTELGKGSPFKGSIAVVYTGAEDPEGAPSRVAIATLTGTVIEGEG